MSQSWKLIINTKFISGAALAVMLVNAPFLISGAQSSDFQSLPLAAITKGLRNWGIFNTAKVKSHIQAVDAWKLQEGSRDVIVAVIDTGIDPQHKDLAQNLWHDPTDLTHPTSFGFNFVDRAQNPVDVHGHGTHVAGIIGGELDIALGISGVAHRVSIMPIKYYSEANSGVVNLSNTISAINFAVDHGARIINYSGGGPEFAEKEYAAIKRAESKGVLFVAAAGNEGGNIDDRKNYYFPASYSNPSVPVYRLGPGNQFGLSRPKNILVVAATDIENHLIPASNWGQQSVDVAAPGDNILSTLPNGKSGYMSGTSQATAFVTGMAALLLSENPKLTPDELKEIIISTSDRVPELVGKVVAAGHVNVFEALKKAHRVSPLAPKASKSLASAPKL